MEISLHWWAVIVAALAQWLLGWAWYGPIFGKAWMKLTGQSMDGGSKSDGIRAMVWGLLCALVMSLILAMLISSAPLPSVWCGLLIGATMWLGFIATTMINPVLYERRPFKLYVLNSGYYLISLAIMGLILASWR
jgi:hypothetical protein